MQYLGDEQIQMFFILPQVLHKIIFFQQQYEAYKETNQYCAVLTFERNKVMW